MNDERELTRKIEAWVKPLITKIGNVEVRDVFKERNTPLQLDSKVVHEAYVSSKRGGSRNEQQK
jgi:hypothetical protein